MEKLILISVLWSLGGCATYLPNGAVPPAAQEVVCEKHGSVLVTPEKTLDAESYKEFVDAVGWIRLALESSKCFESVGFANRDFGELKGDATVLSVAYERRPAMLLTYMNMGLTVLTLGIIPTYATTTYTIDDLRRNRGELKYKRVTLVSTFLLFRKGNFSQLVVDSVSDEVDLLKGYLFK
ncbi:MAG: hypothetical protein KUL82_12620 [Bdellovibrio sp.]|nr:hypothetical protein [Bdellovibrio sp.]